jgi:ATP-binding protein involved in chromosome partitioning
MVSTPQAVALADAYKAATMFSMTPVKVPILGIIENMSYFSPPDMPEKKYHIFGEGGGKAMADEFQVPFLGEVPILVNIREGSDKGSPAVLEANSVVQKTFFEIAEKVAQQIALLNAKVLN